ncbi:MAG: class I SAM-dependent methyltransferase [Actinomycetota bacterium]
MSDHAIAPKASGVQATEDVDRQAKAATRAAWALGDYHKFARGTIWELGPVLVEACGISAGQRVLDVAAGTGNTAIRAAENGADVVASDLTPENFEAGRFEAKAHGVELEWVEADAEDLPFGDSEFDVVTSSFGAMFAPNHQAVADELMRVCRPGGTIGMLNFTPRACWPTSSLPSCHTCRRLRRERTRRCCGAARDTCANCSAMAWSRWR